jgi:hypothetical protein
MVIRTTSAPAPGAARTGPGWAAAGWADAFATVRPFLDRLGSPAHAGLQMASLLARWRRSYEASVSLDIGARQESGLGVNRKPRAEPVRR